MGTLAGVLFHILIFPGFLFLATAALLAEYVDRKLCARLPRTASGRRGSNPGPTSSSCWRRRTWSRSWPTGPCSPPRRSSR